MTDEHPTQADSLRRIAATLGVPAEDFFQDAEPHHLLSERECMRLWYRLRTDTGRDAALDALRKVLDDEGSETQISN